MRALYVRTKARSLVHVFVCVPNFPWWLLNAAIPPPRATSHTATSRHTAAP
jgi:hypothetical protein